MTTMASEITVADLEAACDQVAAKRAVVEGLSAEKKQAEKALEDAEENVLALFKKLDKTSYDSRAGKFIISHRMSVKLPATPEDREAFFDYLKAKGMFENTVTVHSATLNKIYKDEFMAAKERGDEDFAIPGIGPATMAEILSVRK